MRRRRSGARDPSRSRSSRRCPETSTRSRSRWDPTAPARVPPRARGGGTRGARLRRAAGTDARHHRRRRTAPGRGGRRGPGLDRRGRDPGRRGGVRARDPPAGPARRSDPGARARRPGDGRQVIVEGILLARYAYEPLKRKPGRRASRRSRSSPARLSATPWPRAPSAAAASRARRCSPGTSPTRRRPTSPPRASRTSPCAVGADRGLEVEVFDQAAPDRSWAAAGCSASTPAAPSQPRMIKLTYRAGVGDARRGHLALVGKGIMYDSGGISLKPARRGPRADEERHVGRRGDPRRDVRAARPGLPRRP